MDALDKFLEGDDEALLGEAKAPVDELPGVATGPAKEPEQASLLPSIRKKVFGAAEVAEDFFKLGRLGPVGMFLDYRAKPPKDHIDEFLAGDDNALSVAASKKRGQDWIDRYLETGNQEYARRAMLDLPLAPDAESIREYEARVQAENPDYRLPDDLLEAMYRDESSKPMTQVAGETLTNFLSGLAETGFEIAKGVWDISHTGSPLSVAAKVVQGKPLKEAVLEEASGSLSNIYSFGEGIYRGTRNFMGMVATSLEGGTRFTDWLLGESGTDKGFDRFKRRYHLRSAYSEDLRQNKPMLIGDYMTTVGKAAKLSYAPMVAAGLITPEQRHGASKWIDDYVASVTASAPPVNPSVAMTAEITSPVNPFVLGLGLGGQTLAKMGVSGMAKQALGGILRKGTGSTLERTGSLLEMFGAKGKAMTAAIRERLGNLSESITGNAAAIEEADMLAKAAAGRLPLRHGILSSLTFGTAEGLGKALKDIGRNIPERPTPVGVMGRVARDVEAKSKPLQAFARSHGGKLSDAAIRKIGGAAEGAAHGMVIAPLIGFPDLETGEDLGRALGAGVVMGMFARMQDAMDPMSKLGSDFEASRNYAREVLDKVRKGSPETAAAIDRATSFDYLVERTRQDLEARRAEAKAKREDPNVAAEESITADRRMIAAEKSYAHLLEMGKDPVARRAVEEHARMDVADVFDMASRDIGITRTPDVVVRIVDTKSGKALIREHPEIAPGLIAKVMADRGVSELDAIGLVKSEPALADDYIGLRQSAWTGKYTDFKTRITKPAIVVNYDNVDIASRGLVRAIRHDLMHQIRMTEEGQETLAQTEDLLFDRKVRLADGSDLVVSKGEVPDSVLLEKWNTYLARMTPGDAAAMEARMDAEATARGVTPQDARIEYMKSEYIAELVANLRHLPGPMSAWPSPGSRERERWEAIKRHEADIDAAARQFELETGIDPRTMEEGYSSLLRQSFSPRARRLAENFVREVRRLDTPFNYIGRDPSGLQITEEDIRRNPALAEQYKGANIFDMEVQEVLRDSQGNILNRSTVPENRIDSIKHRMDKPEVLPNGNTLTFEMGIKYMPDPKSPTGKSPRILSKKEYEARAKNRGLAIREAIDSVDQHVPTRMKEIGRDEKGNTYYAGTPTEGQMQALMNVDPVVLTAQEKAKIQTIVDGWKRTPGQRFYFEYVPHLETVKPKGIVKAKNIKGRRGRQRYRALKPRYRDEVVIGFHFSKDDHFYTTSISVSRIYDKINYWQREKPQAFDLWGGNTEAFWEDMKHVIRNHLQGKPAAEGIGPEKANRIFDFMNLVDKANQYKVKDPLSTFADQDRTIASRRVDAMNTIALLNEEPLPFNYYNFKTAFLPEERRVGDAFLGKEGFSAYATEQNRPNEQPRVKPEQVEAVKKAKTIIPPEYSINTTGDACVGDEVAFEQAIFTGSFRRPKFAGTRLVTGKIISDSYGREKQQHTFTLELPNGEKLRIKGRNLYRNGLYRKPWANESDRIQALKEKHERGAVAREARQWRKMFMPSEKSRKENLSTIQTTTGGLLTPPGEHFLPAYHGTPHKIEEGFKMELVGTGEGSHVFGYGLYFSENPLVAEMYQKNLGGGIKIEFDGKPINDDMPLIVRIAAYEIDSAQDVNKAIKSLKYQINNKTIGFLKNPKRTEEILKFLEENKNKFTTLQKGNIYKVDLDIRPEEFLDWDKRISEQEKSVQIILNEIARKYGLADKQELENYFKIEKRGRDFVIFGGLNEYGRAHTIEKANEIRSDRIKAHEATGNLLYSTLSLQLGSPKAASEYLNSKGIKGIRYLDQFSRRNIQLLKPDETVSKVWVVKEIPNGEVFYKGENESEAVETFKRISRKTYNYVIFDENKIRILEENGRPVSAKKAMSGKQGEQFMPSETTPGKVLSGVKSIPLPRPGAPGTAGRGRALSRAGREEETPPGDAGE